jgi:hypothetical protein
MTIEIYTAESNNSVTVVEKGDERSKKLLEPDAIKLREIVGKDIDDCMRQHYELMGWEPYKAFTD